MKNKIHIASQLLADSSHATKSIILPQKAMRYVIKYIKRLIKADGTMNQMAFIIKGKYM